MASIEILPCSEIARRLKEVKAQMPPTGECLNDLTARRKLRIKEIAAHAGLYKEQLYAILKGGEVSPELQRKLSGFFSLWDRGALVKEIVNGKGIIVYRDPQSPRSLPPEAASKTLRIEITHDGVKLRL